MTQSVWWQVIQRLFFFLSNFSSSLSWIPESKVREWKNLLPWPACHTLFEQINFLGCKHTLLPHVQFYIHHYSQVLLQRPAINSFITQSVLILWTAPVKMQDLAYSLVELHGVHMDALLKPAKASLDATPSLKLLNCITQLCVTWKPAQGALSPKVYAINMDMEQYKSQYGKWKVSLSTTGALD